jgi:hypothetical protein
MSEFGIPLGVDEQVQSSLVAAQLAAMHPSATLPTLRAIRAELVGMTWANLPAVATASRIPGGHLVHRLFSRLLARHMSVFDERRAQVVRQMILLLDALIVEAEDFESNANLGKRLLLDGVLDRLSLIDALEAKVALLEMYLRDDE